MARHTLSELAEAAGAALKGDGSFEVEGTASLAEAGPREVSFCTDARFEAQLRGTRAGAVVVPSSLAGLRADLNLLVHEEPNVAFARVCGLFAAQRERLAPGRHPTAVIDPSAKLAADVSVGAFVSIGPGAEIAEGVALHAGVRVGARVRIGPGTEVQPNVVLYEGVEIGARCLIHAGCVLGADGFGFFPPAEAGGTWTKIPHSGRVVLQDDVELGANCTVDRARFGTTLLERGVKLDDLVHVGHNVVIGAGSMLAAQVGLAGSVRVGKAVQLGGQVGVGGHMSIGDGTLVAGQSGVIGDVPPGEVWFGYPARPRRQFLKQQAHLGRMDKLLSRVKHLEAKLAALEGPEALSPATKNEASS